MNTQSGETQSDNDFKPGQMRFTRRVRKVSTRELRTQLSDVLGRAQYGDERIAVTRNGKLAAYVISVGDFESFEQLEMKNDIAAYDEAKAEDDGERISLEDVRRDLAS